MEAIRPGRVSSKVADCMSRSVKANTWKQYRFPDKMKIYFPNVNVLNKSVNMTVFYCYESNSMTPGQMEMAEAIFEENLQATLLIFCRNRSHLVCCLSCHFFCHDDQPSFVHWSCVDRLSFHWLRLVGMSEMLFIYQHINAWLGGPICYVSCLKYTFTRHQ